MSINTIPLEKLTEKLRPRRTISLERLSSLSPAMRRICARNLMREITDMNVRITALKPEIEAEIKRREKKM